MTPLERVTARVNRDGDVNNPLTPRQLLTLTEFFDGNNDFGSIGCNLTPPPGPERFHEVLKSIATRSDVSDVRVEITMHDDPEMWPFSATVWIITSAPPEKVAELFESSIRPDQCSVGWSDSVKYEAMTIPPGMRPIACWWD